MKKAPATIRCTKCGAAFACDPAGECWCKDEEFRLKVPASAAESCICPKCLRAMAASEDPPHPTLSPRDRVERGKS